jgi:hypothetical protein
MIIMPDSFRVSYQHQRDFEDDQDSKKLLTGVFDNRLNRSPAQNDATENKPHKSDILEEMGPIPRLPKELIPLEKLEVHVGLPKVYKPQRDQKFPDAHPSQSHLPNICINSNSCAILRYQDQIQYIKFLR